MTYLVTLFPESQRLQALNMQDKEGKTVLHAAARSGNLECIKAILSFYPESLRMQIVNVQDREGNIVLHLMGDTTRKAIIEWLAKAENASFKRSHHEEADIEQPEAKRQRSDEE